MTTDIDKLIAEFRSEGNEWGGKYGALFFKAAEALESTAAERDKVIRDLDAGFAESDHLSAKYYQRMRDAERELQQERERADEAFGAGLAQVSVRAGRAEAELNRNHLRRNEVATERDLALIELARAGEVISEALRAAPKLGDLHWRNVDRMIGILAAYDTKGQADD